MPLLTQTVGKDYADMYSGYDTQKVGAGMMNPDIYATPEYSKKKIKNLVLGGISEVVYSGFDHDSTPKIVPFIYERAFNTVLAFNLNYVPPKIRRNILKFILDSNAARIKSNQPIIIKYDAIKRVVPQVAGIVRRYKIVLLNVKETYQLNEWPEIAKEQSKWQNMYKEAGGR